MPGTGTMARRDGLQEDLGCHGRFAALLDELDGPVEIRLAMGEALCQVDRIARFDQYVQPPARDLFAIGLVVFGDLGHSPRLDFVLSLTNPARGSWLVAAAQRRAVGTESCSSTRRASSCSRRSSTTRSASASSAKLLSRSRSWSAGWASGR